jgi:hypothetical protein
VVDEGGGFGVQALIVDSAGQAIINVPARYSYPGIGDAERNVPNGEDTVIAKYSANGSAVVWSTFVGGGFVRDLALDAAGNIYGIGGTSWGGGPFNATPGAFQTVAGGGSTDITVFKLNASGAHFEYSSLLGGSANESAGAVAVTPQGELVAVGWTESGNFPVTSGAYDTTPNGDEYPPGSGAYYRDVFVTKFSSDGTSVVKGTLLGGEGWDQAYGVSLTGNGTVVIAGLTHGGQFPLTTEAPQYFQYRNFTYVASFDANLSSLRFSSAFNGTGGQSSSDVPLGTDGSAFVTGTPDYQGGFNTTQGVYQSSSGPGFMIRLSMTEESTPTPVVRFNITLTTNPANLTLIIDGQENASTRFQWEEGSTHSVEAPATVEMEGSYYDFSNWSDGGARAHNITASGDLSLQANYTEITQETFVLFFAPGPGLPRSQPQIEVEAGESQTFVVEVANLNNYTGPAISITVPSPPAGVSVDCNPITISPPQNSTCTVHASSQATAGNFTVKVVATNGTFVQEMSVPITISPTPPRQPPVATPNDLFVPVIIVVAAALVLFGLLRFSARRGRR